MSGANMESQHACSRSCGNRTSEAARDADVPTEVLTETLVQRETKRCPLQLSVGVRLSRTIWIDWIC